jgi:hypothetical protein
VRVHAGVQRADIDILAGSDCHHPGSLGELAQEAVDPL